jgi:hypothetical protein
MRIRSLATLAALAFIAAAPHAYAQSTPTSEPQQTQPPVTPQAQADAADTKPGQAPKTDKKVWTEDEVNTLHSNGPDSISQTGNPAAIAPDARPKTASANGNKDAKWYHDQITRLQAKLPPIEKNIAELRGAISGKPTGDAEKSTRPSGVNTDDWNRQLAAAQKQRDDIFAQISALRDEARHKGVPPNALP